ncbi:MAG: hypothetical protein U0800_12555 [Isosphaeraceae bacterium]
MNADDLLAMAELLREAYAWIKTQKRADAKGLRERDGVTAKQEKPGGLRATHLNGETIMSVLNKPENFAGRVRHAASVISLGKGTGRAFDGCFENYDGDAVAAALMRRAEKNERLRANLFRYINQQSATEAYERYKGRNLVEVARELREEASRKQAERTATK